MRHASVAVILFVLLLRLPFLSQPIQGDDVYYLAGAQHALIDPAHPLHARYIFGGRLVDMRGHPHPPLNAWCLALLLALFGEVRPVPFHAVYILFSLIAALSMLSLGRRFLGKGSLALWATLLFCVTPPFVVNGNSLESDVPFLAFWMASTAAFVRAVSSRNSLWLAGAAVLMVPAAMAAFQSVILVPVLAVYTWLQQRRWMAAWAVLFVVPAVLAGWQLFERLTSGALPAAVLTGYFRTYHLQSLAAKATNAAALTAHLAWVAGPLLALAAFGRGARRTIAVAVLSGLLFAAADAHPLFWASAATGVLILLETARRWRQQPFLTAWLWLFFAGALVLFFAGSARYLLPLAAPLAMLVTSQLAQRTRLLAAGIGLQLVLGLGLAWANYDHWNGYRQFASELRPQTESRRVWVNGEWGLRFYLESDGALPLQYGQSVRPGELVVSSKLGFPQPYTTGGGVRAPFLHRPIRSALPFRLIGLHCRSAYSTASLGLRPFDLTRLPIDEVIAEMVLERQPALSYLPMNAPEADSQIVSGLFDLEPGGWRWSGPRAVILLKRPAVPEPVQAEVFLHEALPARRVTLAMDGAVIADQTYPGAGRYTLRSTRPVGAGEGSATLVITVDRAAQPPGDQRELGLILVAAGFRP